MTGMRFSKIGFIKNEVISVYRIVKSKGHIQKLCLLNNLERTSPIIEVVTNYSCTNQMKTWRLYQKDKVWGKNKNQNGKAKGKASKDNSRACRSEWTNYKKNSIMQGGMKTFSGFSWNSLERCSWIKCRN